MIIVTGGAGFIGSNLVKGLNEAGRSDVLIVDNLSNAAKCRNLSGLDAMDIVDKEDFAADLKKGVYNYEDIDVIFHQGACSDTLEDDGRYMMRNNYEYGKQLLNFCLERKIPFIYASSASVYGDGQNGFRESKECEQALNVYALSKLFFDRYVERKLPQAHSRVVGLRYFNVFGPQENHKGKMASMCYKMYRQMKADGAVQLFAGTGGYGDGGQSRDFIYVKDVVKINLFFWRAAVTSGVFNCGTGEANTFNALAGEVLKHFQTGRVEYIPFPEALSGKYQNHTKADTAKLLAAGYRGGFTPLAQAVGEYCRLLDASDGYLR
ncbi:MAG: ADP-glyceromanno-heptose 6-epimerase [Acidaminococcales bacterium]|jgi:ADP-L-glycero-D-manno-heptose 6-epimerase|nr:ADP-glyceromanno-heptose 6-epimerase [Acidaminococcales bacterium]